MFSKVDYMTVADHRDNDDWPFEWLPIKGLLPYIRRLGPDTIGIEIGVARAESSYAILESCKNVTKLYGIDPYLAYKDWNGSVDQEHNDKTKSIALGNMKEFGDRWQLEEAKSDDWVIEKGKSHTGKIGFVFIDGDHSYEGAKNDIQNYYPLVKSGGIFAGHDYNLETVRKALEEFRQEYGIRFPINKLDNNTWFMTKTQLI